MKIIKTFIFRFLAVYFFIFAVQTMFTPGGLLPDYFWDKPVTLAGKLLIDRDYFISESTLRYGDTPYNYLLVFCLLVIAFTATLIWQIADRRRKNDDRPAFLFMELLRYGLASCMFTYGIIKVMGTQFGATSFSGLDQRFGEKSPMEVLWTFMGYSYAYTAFTGILEILSGALLLFRRTKIAGALLSIGLTANIAMMNLSYDIPVKILSIHLFLISWFILIPDSRRLLNFFFLNQPVSPSPPLPLFIDTWPRMIRITMACLPFILVIYLQARKTFITYKIRQTQAPGPIAGGYEVIYMSPVGIVTWNDLYINSISYAVIRDIQGDKKTDTIRNELSMINIRSNLSDMEFHYARPQNDELVLTGKVDNKNAIIRLKKKNSAQYRLNNYKFRWVNEYADQR
ncbi:hypothetical protein ECE50_009790 [Chitinophaga sp. Mgbs1]|uniref:Uncharacterized protein n=1 Tax=Chitinophaga solisilvae TaxID=1233460 RepID=A0A3S1CZU4_9BACT|nr:hypothetical protein [Chitinophaga solisilvae]